MLLFRLFPRVTMSPVLSDFNDCGLILTAPWNKKYNFTSHFEKKYIKLFNIKIYITHFLWHNKENNLKNKP